MFTFLLDEIDYQQVHPYVSISNININVLIIKFGLECSLHKQRNYTILYIKSKSIKKNLHNLLPYMDESMLYKLLGRKYK